MCTAMTRQKVYNSSKEKKGRKHKRRVGWFSSGVSGVIECGWRLGVIRCGGQAMKMIVGRQLLLVAHEFVGGDKIN